MNTNALIDADHRVYQLHLKKPPRNDNTGRKTEVYTFKSQEDIAKISSYLYNESAEQLKDRCRNYLFFSLGINMGFRGSDLVQLKWGDIFIPGTREFNNKDWNTVTEDKTNKSRQIVINLPAQKAIMIYLNTLGFMPEALDPQQYVFASRKHKKDGSQGHMSANSMYVIVKDAAIATGIEFNVGNHSLRKTFGYNLYQSSGKDLALVQRVLNHSSPLITTRYIGIDQEMTRTAYNNMADLVWTP